jgi:uncharacterized protein (TIGR00255 family)
MTGFGCGTAVGKGIKVAVELSSVNKKQLDVYLRLPRELHVLEPQVQALVQKRVSRGRIHGEVQVQFSGALRRNAVRVDRQLAEGCVAELRRTANKLGLKDDLGASTLLKFPQIVTLEESQMDTELIGGVVLRAFDKALRALVAMRNAEGKELRADLVKRLNLLAKGLKVICRCAPAVAARYQRDLKARIAEAGFALPDDDGRLLKEIAFFADRSDVTEETTRLHSHILQGHQLLQSREPVGRALDFLAQEMFREINTIGSKANDSDIIKEVIAFKTELERFREQVQNIE